MAIRNTHDLALTPQDESFTFKEKAQGTRLATYD